MDFAAITKLETRKKADALIIPCWQGEKKAEPAKNVGKLKTVISNPIEMRDFTGAEGEVFFLYADKQAEKRFVLLGLGKKEKGSKERLRRAYASLGKVCRKKKLSVINLLVPEVKGLHSDEVIAGVAEGLLLVSYSFEKLKGKQESKDQPVPIKKVNLIDGGKNSLTVAKKCAAICQGVYLTRDLVNDNADEVTPQHFSALARKFAKNYKQVTTTVFDKKRILKEKMGLLLAVNRGSDRDPALIIMKYRGNPRSKDHTVVVGKGITYDTGGLNLKPTGSMETMKSDMAGAAMCFGLVAAAASVGLKENFTVVVATTENSIGSKSFKPGDVYSSYAGKTVEIGNTDAEGRLILADALAYAVKHLKPSRVIDFATLTGAVGVALGDEASGLMGNDDALADALFSAGEATFERLWRLPLYEEYREQLQSDIADIKNIGNRSAGTCTAAMFLKEFVGDIPWAHCDIASTAFLSKEKGYCPKYATGVGVRLMIEFFEQRRYLSK